MRILAYLAAVALVLLGLAMAALGPGLPANAAAPAKPVVAGLLLAGWGFLLAAAARARYRGGTPSYVGAVLFGFGIWAGAGPLLWRGGGDLAQHLLIACALLGAGVVLLIYGHRIHARVVARIGMDRP